MSPSSKFAAFNVAAILLFAVPSGAEIVSDPPEAHSPITLLAVSNRTSDALHLPLKAKSRLR